MAELRFKPEFLKSIVKPEIIELSMLNVGHFKTYTTRIKPKKCREYEVVCGIPPKPLFYRYKTGIHIEIVECQQKAVKNYTQAELIGDIGHCDRDRFIQDLNRLNKSRKSAQYTQESVMSLHQFNYLSGGENVNKALKEIEELWRQHREHKK